MMRWSGLLSLLVHPKHPVQKLTDLPVFGGFSQDGGGAYLKVFDLLPQLRSALLVGFMEHCCNLFILWICFIAFLEGVIESCSLEAKLGGVFFNTRIIGNPKWLTAFPRCFHPPKSYR